MNLGKRVLVLGTILVGMIGCGGNLSINSVKTRFANFVPDGARLDFYVNGSRISQGRSYLELTGYAVLRAGTTDFTITATGGGPVLAQTSSDVQEPQRYTVAAVGRANPPVGQPGYSLVIFPENSVAPPSGTSQFRVAHVAPSALALDWYVTLSNVNLDNVSPDFSDIEFSEASTYLNFGVGSRRIRATLAGTKTVVLDTNFTFAGRNIYTLYLRDAVDGGAPLQAEVLTDGS